MGGNKVYGWNMDAASSKHTREEVQEKIRQLAVSIEKLRDDCVASGCKVDGPEWRAVVAQCKLLRVEISKLRKKNNIRELNGSEEAGYVARATGEAISEAFLKGGQSAFY